MPAFGTSSFAVTPYGAGSDATASAPPEDSPDAAKFLNPITGDYERNADGSYKRMPITRQRVLIALASALRSSTIDPDGTNYPDKIDENYEAQVRAEVQRVLAFLVNEGEIVIDGVTVEQYGTGRVVHTVAYTASDGISDSVTV